VINVLEDGVLSDFDFFKWISGELPSLTLLMSTRAISEMAAEISSLLSICYPKALSSTNSPDVKFWLSAAKGYFNLEIVSNALKIYESSSIGDALLDAVASEIGETAASLKESSSLRLAERVRQSEIISSLESHMDKLSSSNRLEPKVCPLSLFTLQPLKEFETLPRETDTSSVKEFTLRLSKAFSLVNDIEPGYSSELGYLINHVVPLKCDDHSIYSGSNSSLPGIAFMSSHIRDYRLVAEMAIHEAMHIKLFLLQRWDAIFESDEDINWRGCKAYSPWRECMRPVQGVLHGAFVFTSISKFWSDLSNTDNDIAARRAATASLESLIAIDQVVKQSALTDWGTRLIEALQRLNHSVLDNYPKPEQMLAWSPERSIEETAKTISENTQYHLEQCDRLSGA
jgi:hypothetical protein